jgi:ABC-type polysaccharide/polyol phosphate transport system ATPase subunit
MRGISEHNGVQFNCLWFDESLDGCDDSVKAKAIRLFEELALTHESVFLVEHSSEIKASVSNRIGVSLRDGKSILDESNS